MSLFNLFVIATANRRRQVQRVRFSGDAQAQISLVLHDQCDAFLDKDRERHPFEPGFRPTDGGIVTLKFELPHVLARLVHSIPADVPVLGRSLDGMTIHALVGVDPSRQRVCFQALDRRRVLGPHRPVLFAGRDAYRVTDAAGLVIGPRLDAVHEGGVLHFISEMMVRRFLDFDEVFREATDAEVLELFDGPLFADVDDEVLLGNANTWARRKVRFIATSGLLEKMSLTQLRVAAKKCGVTLSTEKGKIVVPESKAGLRELLKFLGEDYLQSLARSVVFEVASKRRRNVT